MYTDRSPSNLVPVHTLAILHQYDQNALLQKVLSEGYDVLVLQLLVDLDLSHRPGHLLLVHALERYLLGDQLLKSLVVEDQVDLAWVSASVPKFPRPMNCRSLYFWWYCIPYYYTYTTRHSLLLSLTAAPTFVTHAFPPTWSSRRAGQTDAGCLGQVGPRVGGWNCIACHNHNSACFWNFSIP